MNINEPDEVSIFRFCFLSFIKQLKFMSSKKLTMSLKTSKNFYNYLVQILVQKVIQYQKKPVTIGFFLYSLMPIAGIEPVTYALRVRCSTN